MLDIRLLAHQIIKNFPWVIGVELRRLFSANLLESMELRYRQLSKTVDRLIEVLSFIIASEWMRCSELDKALTLSSKELEKGLQPNGKTDRLDFIKVLDKRLKQGDRSLLLPNWASCSMRLSTGN